MDKPHVVILGAGPAGLGAAFQLSRRGLANVTVLDQNSWVGGNAASFDLAGVRVDYGSHRLHPACDPAILDDIRALVGEDLLERPRHGRIRMRGRWIHFPLKPVDLLLSLPPSFALGVTGDMAGKVGRGLLGSKAVDSADSDNFATVLEAGLGRTICNDFYFPYARKIWGLPPEELSGAQARRRVSADSMRKMLQKVTAVLPGAKSTASKRFFYPRQGYGQISERYAQAAQDAGVYLALNARVHSVLVGKGTSAAVRYERDGRPETICADYVWSTIPITALARSLETCPPRTCMAATASMKFRAMILIYLVLRQERFTEYDAHYFPEAGMPISRLSEPKNFSDGFGEKGVTVLCAELPCSPDDPVWQATDEELGILLRKALESVGQPVTSRVEQVVTRRLKHAYPIYQQGYETAFEQLDHWMDQFDDLLTFGRQGLFSHDNLHHALYMAYSAVDCMRPNGHFDRDQWQSYRREFETHVVED